VIITDQKDALINAISYIFPSSTHLLCIWHLNKNLLSNCRKYFSTSEEYDEFQKGWNALAYADTEEDYEKLFLEWEKAYKIFPNALDYFVKNHYPIRKKFCKPWTNKFRHLGTISTSRVECMHQQIKSYLITSRQDIHQVADALQIAVEAQFSEITISIEREKVVTQFRHGDIFREVRNKISEYALDMVLKEEKNAVLGSKCTGIFWTVYGLPCSHIILEKKLCKETLQVKDFISQWR